MRYSTTIIPRILSIALISAIFSTSISAQVINEDVKLLPADGASGDAFGHAISIHDGVAVIGANGDDDNGTNSGSAYIMHLILDGMPVKLLAFDGAANDLFGHAVAIGSVPVGTTTQTYAVAGAPNHSALGTNSGAAYVFNLSGTQLHKLVPFGGAAADHFGESVAIDNGVIVVGAPDNDDNANNAGAAYLFDANTGVQFAKLLPNEVAVNDNFGHAVAIDNGLVAVSAPRHINGGIESGTVYIFSAFTGQLLGQFASNEGVPFEQFGYSLAMDDGFVAVGALATGSAYVYDATTQARVQSFTPTTPAIAYGWSIDIDASKLVVGAISDTVNGQNSGSAFLYNAFTGTQLAKLLPSDGALFDQFGASISIHNDLIVAGARNDNDHGGGSGSAYAFDIFCPADLNGDGLLNFFDVSAFLVAFNNMNPIADFNNDGLFNFFDISAFLAAFSAGCP